MGSFRGRLAAIVGLGLGLRVLNAALLADDATGPAGDIIFFHSAANLIAEGHGYIAPYTLVAEGRSLPTAEHPPLWPFLLALASELGATGHLAHRLVGCLMGAGALVAIGLIGRRVAGEPVGLVAAGIGAAYPVLIGADGSLMSESLYGLGIAATLLAAYRLLDRPTAGSAVLLGLAIGLSALVRGEALLLLALLAGPVAWRAGPGRLPRLALAVAAAAAAIAPWTARNWATFDRPVLISTNESTVIVGANCHATYSGPDIGFWRDDCRTPIRETNEAVRAARFRREGLEYAADHVERLPLVAAVRVLRTWGAYQPRRQVSFAEGRHRRVEQAGVLAYLVLLPLAAYGALLLRRRGEPLAILLAPVLLVTLTSIAAYGYTRFRHAAEISLVVLAAVAVTHLWERRPTSPGG